MKLVLFTLADKEYGVDINGVRQVIRMKEIVPVPDAAAFVEGVIALRGKVVPLVNLRKKIGVNDAASRRWNRIIITRSAAHDMGVMVDRVTDVVSVEEGAITPPDDVLKDAKYLIGVAKVDKRLVLVVDMEKILTGEDRDGLKALHGRVEVKRREA